MTYSGYADLQIYPTNDADHIGTCLGSGIARHAPVGDEDDVCDGMLSTESRALSEDEMGDCSVEKFYVSQASLLFQSHTCAAAADSFALLFLPLLPTVHCCLVDVMCDEIMRVCLYLE